MPTFEASIIDKLLGVVRAKRSEEEGVRSGNGKGKAVRRPAQFTDFEAIADLKQRHGLGTDSLANWERLWVHNPALAAWREPPAIGWVLEDGSKIVGYMGSIPLSYQFGERTLRAVTTHALVVEPEYRALAAGIVTAFFRQSGVDLFLNTTAVPAAAKLVMALGAKPVAQSDYGKVLFWILDRRAFTRAVGRKIGLSSVGQALAGAFGPVALLADSALRRRGAKKPGTHSQIRRISVGDIGKDFDELWSSEVSSRKSLLSARSSAILRWHFSGPRTKSDVTVLAAHRAGKLRGYVCLLTNRDGDTGLQRCLVADLFVRKDDPVIAAELIASALESAKDNGNHVFEIIGFPHSIRSICLRGKPYARDYPACPFYFKANDAELMSTLATESAWYASPYDGDSSIGS